MITEKVDFNILKLGWLSNMAFRMDIKEIKIDSSQKIEKRLGINEGGSAQFFLRNEFDRLMDPYIPMLTGTLKNQKTYPSSHEIKYISPYAHYQYIGNKAVGASKPLGIKRTISGVSLKYSGAPKRGARWDKRMWSDQKTKILKDLNNFIKNGG